MHLICGPIIYDDLVHDLSETNKFSFLRFALFSCTCQCPSKVDLARREILIQNVETSSTTEITIRLLKKTIRILLPQVVPVLPAG